VEPSRRLEILFVAERLLPATGGGERYALELLDSLSERHGVRALWLPSEKQTGAAVRELPPGVDGSTCRLPLRSIRKRARRDRRLRAILGAVSNALRERPADVLVTQAGAAPAAVAAAEQAGIPTMLLLPSYVSLCPRAFDPSKTCLPELGCLACANGSLRRRRRHRIMAESRSASEAAVARASALIAPSEAVAETYERWTGQRAEVAAPVVAPQSPVGASVRGHVAMISAKWHVTKGVELVGPIARALANRRLLVSEHGLPRRLRRELAALPHVRLAGYSPLGELLSGASLLLVPSQWQEPFGRIAFEGLSAGVPVLASAVGGLVEFMPEDGLVRPHAAPEAWLRAIRSLDDLSRWEEARRRGLEAAGRVLATSPVDRIENVLLRVAA
jgi:glycosyltransferase involved in cell wall biosynthesis